MNRKNRKLLEELHEKCLTTAINSEAGSKEEKEAIAAAMDVTTKQTEQTKINTSTVVQLIGFGATAIAAPVIAYFFNKKLSKYITSWELAGNTFTTSAGRGLTGLLRFKN